jgi:hypothetical protein
VGISTGGMFRCHIFLKWDRAMVGRGIGRLGSGWVEAGVRD